MRKALLLLVFLFTFNFVFSATISGEVYEWYNFEKLDNVVVEINTIPTQRDVSVNGIYSFEVASGEYKIVAQYFENGELVYEDSQDVNILSEGNFTVDLIMFPVFGDISDELDAIDFNDIDSTVTETEIMEDDGNNMLFGVGIVSILLILGIIVLFVLQKSGGNNLLSRKEKIVEKEEKLDDYAEQVLALLRRRGNRLTQKEIRDEMKDIGEAKVSLIIAELESMGKVKKIKKGRGNIIVLKEK